MRLTVWMMMQTVAQRDIDDVCANLLEIDM